MKEEKEEYEELKNLLYTGQLSQYGKRKLIEIIETPKAELEKLKSVELKTKGGGIKVTLEGIVNLQQELKKKDKIINMLKDELGYTRKLVEGEKKDG